MLEHYWEFAGMIQLKSALLALLIIAGCVAMGLALEVAFARFMLLHHIGLAP
jgi:hypothetical protein